MALQSFAVLSALVATVLAQSQNPFIPSGITPTCAAYLSSLDSDASLASCLESLSATLSPFSPSASSTPPSASALDTLCTSTSTSCSPEVIGAALSAFYAACSIELTSSLDKTVLMNYDALYIIEPLQGAICSKGDSGDYCATKSPKPSNATSSLFTTTSSPGSNITYYFPNAATFQSENVAFLFLEPSMPPSDLCNSCTSTILTEYISWMSSHPYGPGSNQSQLLSGEFSLYNSVKSQCGPAFLGGAVQAAGGLSSGLVSAASRVGGYDLSAAVSTVLGAVALVVASF